MTIKAEMLFQSSDQESGWSEVYYVNQATIAQAEAALDALFLIRSTFLSSDFILLGYRITAPLAAPGPGYLRAQRTAYLAEKNIPGNCPNGGGNGAQSLVGVMLRLTDTTRTIFKNQTYRGVPAQWFQGSDKIARANYANWGIPWQQSLIAQGVQIRHATRAVPSYAFVNIALVEYRRMDYRKAGRSFETLRGRR
jgi:hypothetical protein